MGRLYGIGAALDPAGVRFSIVLLLIVYLLCEDEGVKQVRWKTFACLFAFFVIAVIGNMISRTTSVGLFLGIVYLICSRYFPFGNQGSLYQALFYFRRNVNRIYDVIGLFI